MLRKLRKSVRSYPWVSVLAVIGVVSLVLDVSNRDGLAKLLLVLVSLAGLTAGGISFYRVQKHGYFGVPLLLMSGIALALFGGELWTAFILSTVIILEQPLKHWLSTPTVLQSAMHTQLVRKLDRLSILFAGLVLIIAAVSRTTIDSTTALTVVAVASTGPLLLVAPLSLAAGLQRARLYAYVRSAAVLERLARTQTLAMSKSGVLTDQDFSVSTVRAFGKHNKDEVLATAAALASQSYHPLAQAIVEKASTVHKVSRAKHVQEEPGLGLRGRMRSQQLLIGRLSFLEENGVSIAKIIRPSTTSVFVAREQDLIGEISFNEHLKPDVKNLHRRLASTGIHLLIASGDSKPAVATVAKSASITDYRSDCTPADKIAAIESAKGPVAFVGDAAADEAALTAADTSIVFYDTEGYNTDVNIPGGEINHLIQLFETAVKNLRRTQYLTLLSLGIVFGLILAGVAGVFSPIQAAGLNLFVSVSLMAVASYVNLKDA